MKSIWVRVGKEYIVKKRRKIIKKRKIRKIGKEKREMGWKGISM